MTAPPSQRQWLVLALLVGVMILVYRNAWRPSSPRASRADSAQALEGPEAGAADPKPSEGAGAALLSVPDPSPQRQAQRELNARLSWARDPFLSGAAGGQAIGFTLSGILWDTDTPMAIINGQMLRPGEEFEGYEVIEIKPDRVSISDGTETFQLVISP